MPTINPHSAYDSEDVRVEDLFVSEGEGLSASQSAYVLQPEISIGRPAPSSSYYNHVRYHESLSNLTPADVYFGRADTILAERERIKRATIATHISCRPLKL
jgi:hypothetical protein